MLSLAPMRVKILEVVTLIYLRSAHLSTGVSAQYSAGTKQPSCAIITQTHACLSSVLFPPIFGPVISMAGGVATFSWLSCDMVV